MHLHNAVAVVAAKGGVGKSATALNTAAALAVCGIDVGLIALDTNESVQDRLVARSDLVAVEDAGPLAALTPPTLPASHHINRLLAGPDDVGLDDVVYRREGLEGLAAYFHQLGTLFELASSYERDQPTRARWHALLEQICARHDVVMVDTPADIEPPLLTHTVLRCATVLLCADLSVGGVRSAVVLARQSERAGINLGGVVISPDDLSRSTVRSSARQALHALAGHLEVPLFSIRRDASVGKAETVGMPLPALLSDEHATRRLRLHTHAAEGYYELAGYLAGRAGFELQAGPERSRAARAGVPAGRQRSQVTGGPR